MLSADQCSRYKVNDKYGLKRKSDGTEIIHPVYDDIRRIIGAKRYLKVKINNQWGVINTSGTLVLKAMYDDIYSYDGLHFKCLIDGDFSYQRNPFVNSNIRVRIIKDPGYSEPPEYGPPRMYSRFG